MIPPGNRKGWRGESVVGLLGHFDLDASYMWVSVVWRNLSSIRDLRSSLVGSTSPVAFGVVAEGADGASVFMATVVGRSYATSEP